MAQKQKKQIPAINLKNTRSGTRRAMSVEIPALIRLDVFLAALMERELGPLALSRSQIKYEIENGKITWCGKVVDAPSARISGVGIIEFEVYEPSNLLYEPDAGIEVIYEDESLIVVNKPAGLAVHPGAGRSAGTLVNKLLPKLAQTDSVRPGIVHRIDKDTTGLLVVAKTVQAHTALAAQFAEHKINRRYQALVLASPKLRRLVTEQDSGTINASLGRSEKLIVVDPNGRSAITHWKVLDRLGYAAILEFQLETGRTHQIRVHAASIRCPVIGDRTYGDFSSLPTPLFKIQSLFGRQALHASALGFIHPLNKKELNFSAPPPADYLKLVQEFREFGSGTGSGVGSGVRSQAFRLEDEAE